jgi:hypothetical protein
MVWVRLRAKWAVLPVWAKWVLALYMIGFADGTADNVRWMTNGGIHAYASSYPQVPIQVFFVILVVADPLIVVLLGLVRREGIWLACAVMVWISSPTGVGNWSKDPPRSGTERALADHVLRRVRACVRATADADFGEGTCCFAAMTTRTAA